MILKRFILVFTILFAATACNNLKGPEKPINLISKKKMVDVLIDAKLMTSASSVNKLTMRDSGLDLNGYVYKRHNIDSLQFALSNNYYAFHVDDYEDIYIQVTDSLEALKVELKAIKAKEWKDKTKREADSLAKALKEKKHNTLNFKKLINKPAKEIDDTLLEESLQELEGLVEPIAD